eukprot:SAG11_NODE_2997_length_2781_cov_2.921700_1_plen_34_part_10
MEMEIAQSAAPGERGARSQLDGRTMVIYANPGRR